MNTKNEEKTITDISTEVVGQSSFLATIERLSANKEVDVNKIQRIIEMQEHILDRNAKQAFNAAMVRCQSKIKTIPRDAKNLQTSSKYSLLETIVQKAAPIYTAEGFSLSFYEGETPKENHIRIMCDVMHEQGHTVTRYRDVPIDQAGIKGTPNKTLVHAEASSATYGRRYMICNIFNIPTGEDDDGNAAGDIDTISEKQIAAINKIIKEKNIDTKKFLKHMKVNSIESIPKDKFDSAMDALKRAKGREKKEQINCPETGKIIDISGCDSCERRTGCPAWD